MNIDLMLSLELGVMVVIGVWFVGIGFLGLCEVFFGGGGEGGGGDGGGGGEVVVLCWVGEWVSEWVSVGWFCGCFFVCCVLFCLVLLFWVGLCCLEDVF